MNRFKKYIPNILTSLRIIAIPFIVFLGLTNHYKILIGLTIFVTLTDWVDGALARKWQVTSKLGANLDAIADKFLAVGLLSILIIQQPIFLYLLILECVIAVLNLFFFFYNGVTLSLLVGKFKTWILFLTIILGFFNLLFPSLNTKLFIYFTLILQVITFISYIIFGINTKKKTIIKNSTK